MSSVVGSVSSQHLNIAHACVSRDVNGPGRRFTVWAQGCPRSCDGCFNPGLRPFETRRRVAAAELAVEAAASGCDGVTLTGGEPFSQAGGLVAFLDALRARRGFADVSAVAFTGHTAEELRGGTKEWNELLRRLDLLVDGPFVRGEHPPPPLRGSANQRLVALTPAGERMIEALLWRTPPAFEVLVCGSGEIILSGFPSDEVVRRIANSFDVGRSQGPCVGAADP